MELGYQVRTVLRESFELLRIYLIQWRRKRRRGVQANQVRD